MASEGEQPAEVPLEDPSLSNIPLDDLLSAEMLPEDADLLLSELPLEEPPAQAPTFQLHIHSLQESDRAALKKALEAQSVTLPEKAGINPTPVISQLTEFQVVSLLQMTRALGIPAHATVQCPEPVPTEDELALGDLSSVLDADLPVLEAAPSVSLPKGEREVLLCSPNHLPGAAVRETFGIVIAHRSIARRLFREEDLREKLEKELRLVPNRPTSPMASSHLQLLMRDLFLDLQKSALAKGGNAVLGVKLEAFPESSTTDPQLEQLRLVAFGTAAVVEKS